MGRTSLGRVVKLQRVRPSHFLRMNLTVIHTSQYDRHNDTQSRRAPLPGIFSFMCSQSSVRGKREEVKQTENLIKNKPLQTPTCFFSLFGLKDAPLRSAPARTFFYTTSGNE